MVQARGIQESAGSGLHTQEWKFIMHKRLMMWISKAIKDDYHLDKTVIWYITPFNFHL